LERAWIKALLPRESRTGMPAVVACRPVRQDGVDPASFCNVTFTAESKTYFPEKNLFACKLRRPGRGMRKPISGLGPPLRQEPPLLFPPHGARENGSVP